MASSLKQLRQAMLPAVEAELRTALRADAGAQDLFYGMIHYHMGWRDEALQPAVGNGGKRIRPLLCLLVCQAAGGQWSQAVPAGAALEILHNFTLVHDDIQDQSPTRHGRPTVWQVWGSAQAINTGDAMFALAHLALAGSGARGVPPDITVRALQRLDETCLELTIGQHLDMDFEYRPSVTEDDYLAMIRGKTAALLALAAELGGLVACAPDDQVAHYAAFGRQLGLAFQVRDDILGIWGDEAVIGKSAATDLAARKKTLPILYGLRHSAALRHHFASPDNDGSFVSAAIELLDECGARDYAEAQARAFSVSARDHLEAANPAGPAAAALDELTGLLLQRQH